MNKFAIIADDQTGAGDSGVHFALAGKPLALILDFAAMEGELAAFNRVVISTDSRFLDGVAAARQVETVVKRCLAAGFNKFFKKIDSTMRGNTGSEITAMLAATQCTAALICPAIPKQGRICRNAEILVNGLPLAESAMGQDPFHPLTTSAIAELLGRQSNLPSCHLSLADVRGSVEALLAKVDSALARGCRLLIADAVEQSDLHKLAELLAIKTELLPVGAAGLAEAISAQEISAGCIADCAEQAEGRMLAVVGSLTDISRTQADIAGTSGAFQVLEFDAVAGRADLDREINRLIAEIQNAPRKHLLLRTQRPNGKEGQTTVDGELVAELLGQVARAICLQGACRIVFATGGSTSMGVAKALGINAVTIERELLPGVVLGSCRAPGMQVRWFITKSGGFGHGRTLQELAECFVLQTEDKNNHE